MKKKYNLIEFFKEYYDLLILIVVNFSIPLLSEFLLFPLSFLVSYNLIKILFGIDIGTCNQTESTCILGGFFVTFSIIIIPCIRFFILPILYTQLESKSKNKYVKNFIYLLKLSLRFKIVFLVFIEFLTFLFAVILNLISQKTMIEIFKDGLQFLLSGIGFNLLSCYIVLFVWWRCEKHLGKKAKMVTR